MKRIIFRILLLSLGAALAVGAQQKAEPKAKARKPDTIQGTVRTMNKDKSQITVRTSQGAERTVLYSADTKWGLGTSEKNTPTSLDKLKEGYFLNCGGTLQGVDLAATFCYFRETK